MPHAGPVGSAPSREQQLGLANEQHVHVDDGLLIVRHPAVSSRCGQPLASSHRRPATNLQAGYAVAVSTPGPSSSSAIRVVRYSATCVGDASPVSTARIG